MGRAGSPEIVRKEGFPTEAEALIAGQNVRDAKYKRVITPN